MRQSPCFLTALAVAAFAVAPMDASLGADWGALTGRFIVDGKLPAPSPLVVTKDQFCIDKNLVSEAVVVGTDDALANAIVSVRLGRREKIEIHSEYDAQMSEAVELDNNGCQFAPHIVLVRSGQPIAIKNSDPVGHNTKVGMFNQIIPAGSQGLTKIDRAAALPQQVSCSIHPFMTAYVLVQDHPYMAVSSENGTFEIKNIPAGKHEFMFWHEAPGSLKGLKIGSGTTDRKGVLALTIKGGETLDLGDIKVPAAVLKARR
jgi:hypothetical protein